MYLNGSILLLFSPLQSPSDSSLLKSISAAVLDSGDWFLGVLPSTRGSRNMFQTSNGNRELVQGVEEERK